MAVGDIYNSAEGLGSISAALFLEQRLIIERTGGWVGESAILGRNMSRCM